MGAEPSNGAVDSVVEFLAMLEDHERSLNEWYRWFGDGFVREDRRRLIAMPTADAATFHEQHLAWFEMDDENLSFSMTEVVAVFGQRLAVTRTQVGTSAGFPVEMLSVSQWTEDAGQLQKIVQFDGDDVDGAVRELDRLRLALAFDDAAG